MVARESQAFWAPGVCLRGFVQQSRARGWDRRGGSPLSAPPHAPNPPWGFWPSGVQVREGAGAAGCEERLRAAGGSVGPGGAREAARGDVSGGPAGSGRHFLYKGGRAGLRLPRAGVGLRAAGGGGRAAGGLSHRGAGLPARSPGCPFRRPGSRRRDICGAETWMYARARERKNGSAQTLRPGRGAGRGEGGAAGAERAERARRCLRAGQERARPAAGLGSRAVSALGRRKCAFAAEQGRRAAGVAAVMRLGRGAGCGPLPH